MHYKTMLTLDDLVKFCEENKFAKFSSNDSGYKLAVKIPTAFEIESSDDNHRGMKKVKIRIFHTGVNRNKSRISKEAAEKAMQTIADRPILAAIHQLDDGSWDFEGHEIKKTINTETGETEVEYIESQVGSFSSEPAFWEHDDKLDKDFVCAYAYIPEDYTRTVSILESKGNWTKNSCELVIEELSYNVNEKILDLESFYLNASTFLGSRDVNGKVQEISEGMEGSRADIVEFSEENNSILMDLQTRISNLEEKFEQTLLNHIEANKEDFNQEGGMSSLKFEELLKKYNVTAEDVSFDYSEMSDDELEAKFEEVFGKNSKDDSDDNNDTDGNADADIDDTDEDVKKDKKTFSITVDGKTVSFEVSLNEKIETLSKIINEMYGETDQTYYCVTVYDEYLIMKDYWNNINYKQSYTFDGEKYSLTGDRVEVFATYLTKEEVEQVDEMRKNYEALVKYKNNVEFEKLHAQREAILSAEHYSVLKDTDKFKSLVENMDKYSLVDLEKEAKILFADYITTNNQTFSLNTNTSKFNGGKKFGVNSESPAVDNESSPYGDYFKSIRR